MSSKCLRDLGSELLARDVEIEIPEWPENFVEDAADFTVRKVVWWILKNGVDPLPKSVIHPELHDEEESVPGDKIPPADYDELDDIRVVSDAEDDILSDGRVRGRSKRSKSAKIVLEEIVGERVLKAKIRRPSAVVEVDSEMSAGDFINIFECAPETNFKDVSGTCIACKERVIGKQQLKDHLNSASHKKCFRKLSLDIGNLQYQENFNTIVAQLDPTIIKAKVKVYNPNEQVTVPIPSSSNKGKISPDEKAAFLRSINIGDWDIAEDHVQNDAKLKLRFANKWTNALDKKWKKMKQEEQVLIDEYKALRSRSIADPSSHPARGKEWLLFWEKRRLQLIKDGKNPDSHNYHPEWASYWLKRMLDLLKADAELKISKLKGRSGMDASSLKHLFHETVSGRVRPTTMPGSRPYNSRNTYQNASGSRSTTNSNYSRNSSHPQRIIGGGDSNFYPSANYPVRPSSLNNPYTCPYPPQPQQRYANNYYDQLSPSPHQIYYNSYNNYEAYNPNPAYDYNYGYYF